MIHTRQGLEELARAASSAAVVGLDTEGDGFYRYRARLCTLQLAMPGRIALVDTLALEDLEPLRELLGAARPEKILHDCFYDARMLAQSGIPLAGVYDTSVAARFLGDVATGLGSLLLAHLGVEVPKEHQRADWGARPLPEDQLAYLENDVAHLEPLAEVMRARCADAGITDEVAEECRYALACAALPEEPSLPWTRVKGVHELRSGRQRAVLRELCLLREALAEADDVPPFRIFPNALLLAVAKRPPRSAVEAKAFGSLRRHARQLPKILEAVERGMSQAEVPQAELQVFRPVPPTPAEREQRKSLEAALSGWRRSEAEARQVTIHVVLPGHCLRALVARAPTELEQPRQIAGLGECRVERYGAALLKCMKSALADPS